MKFWNLFWSPTGQCISTVKAATAQDAVKLAPYPYIKYRGEIYATELAPKVALTN
jgi:hypothetical protein